MSIQFAPRWNNASVKQTCIVADVTDIASSGTSTLLELRVSGVPMVSVDKAGNIAASGSFSIPASKGIVIPNGVPGVTTDTLYNNGGSLYFNGSALSGGGGGGGITSLNTLTGGTQVFATGVVGTDFTISSSGTTHTFNLPDAGASARGLVTTGAQTLAGAKTFSSQVAVPAGGVTQPGIKVGSGQSGMYMDGGGYVGIALNGNWCASFGYGGVSHGIACSSANGIGWKTAEAAAPDLVMWRDAANTLALRNDTNAQTFNLSNTWTSATSFEYGRFQWNTNEFRIGTAVGSAGGTVRDIVIGAWDSAGTFAPGLIITRQGSGNNEYLYWRGGTSSNSTSVGLRASGVTNYIYFGGNILCAGGTTANNNVIFYPPLRYTPNAQTSGSITEWQWTAAAHTGQTASTEASSVVFDLSATKTFAAGALTTQRAFRIQAPTYAFVTASTITTAATLAISGAPAAGTNATITTPLALWVESGVTRLGAPATVGVGSNGLLTMTVDGSGTGFSVVSSSNKYFRFVSGGSVHGFISATNDGLPLEFQSNSGILFTPTSTNLVEQRNSTNAQTFRVYNTYTSATNAEWYQESWVSNEIYLGSAVGSAGGTQRAVSIGYWNSAGTFTTAFRASTVTTQLTSVGDLQLRADSGSNLIYIGTNSGGTLFQSVCKTLRVNTGGFTILQPALTTTAFAPIITTSLGAHTSLTASTEATDINFDLNRTVQFAAGALTTQRAFRIQAPTYAFASASTITTASTLAIGGAPTAGTNATITNAYALNVEAGTSYFAGGIRSVGSSVYSPSYGFGTDNSGFFRSSTSRVFLGLNANVMYDFNAGALTVNQGSFGIAGGSVDSNSADVLWVRDAAGIWATRNSTNAQTVRVYNTYTSSTSHEYLKFSWATNVAEIGTVKGSGGGSARSLVLKTDDTTRLTLGSAGVATLATAIELPLVTKTANYTLTSSDYTVVATSGTFTFTLPTAVGCTGRIYNLKNTGSGVITINTTSSQTIDANASGALTLNQWDNLTIQSDGSNWIIL